MFTQFFSTSADLSEYLICAVTAALLGAVFAIAQQFSSRENRGFLITLATLPLAACTVIMIVNGSVGTGIAVAGSFSLVRFRSMQGTSRQITALFESMAIGLACGAGHPALALAFTLLACLLNLLYSRFGFGSKASPHKQLTITVPEDLQYYGMFDDIFKAYTDSCRMERVKTVNLGSLLRLTYDITLRNESTEKEMIDALRCRNGNLEITCALRDDSNEL